MYKLFRSLLFRLDPEVAHHLTLQLMRIGGIQPINAILRTLYSAPQKTVEAFGLTFKNPVGLAAGYDKDAIAIRGLSSLGFGHIEVGTVTPRPQPGNPKPRVFRLVEDEAVINRMGFPGKGADFVSRQLSAVSRQRSTILGLNLGKNKDTPLEESASDYIALIRTFAPLADYLAINISSPNTVGLRRLQGRAMLEGLLGQISLQRSTFNIQPPILVKLAPDLTDDELEDALGVILDSGMDGVIATNTTLAREGLRSKHREETGGLSGSPLRVRSEALLEKIVKIVAGHVPIVSVGGIMTPEDAKRRLDMGAALIQVYTGLIYRGPGLVREIVEAI
ncbi:MAG: quinone-dependent dihydroorotate dehydrogenase [Anaerolineales bacterium]|nr:quinone-dependent dihydroorotate dehydrogenase [Anaerolineales bacterium]